jgi:hypothetical protein
MARPVNQRVREETRGGTINVGVLFEIDSKRRKFADAWGDAY